MSDPDLTQRLQAVEERLAQVEKALLHMNKLVNELVERQSASPADHEVAPSCDAQGHPDNPPV